MAGKDIDIVIGADDQASNVINRVASKVESFSQSFSTRLTAASFAFNQIRDAASSFYRVISPVVDGIKAAADRVDSLADKANGLGESVGALQEFQFALGRSM
jgi:phage-related protein